VLINDGVVLRITASIIEQRKENSIALLQK